MFVHLSKIERGTKACALLILPGRMAGLVLCEPTELYNILNQVTKLSRLAEPNYLCLLGKCFKRLCCVQRPSNAILCESTNLWELGSK